MLSDSSSLETYVILRRGGWRTPEDLQAAAARSGDVGDNEMSDDIRWLRSYVIAESDGGARNRLRLPGLEPGEDPRACRRARVFRLAPRSSASPTPSSCGRIHSPQRSRNEGAAAWRPRPPLVLWGGAVRPPGGGERRRPVDAHSATRLRRHDERSTPCGCPTDLPTAFLAGYAGLLLGTIAVAGGPAFAAGLINGHKLKPGTVTSAKLAKNAVTAAKIKPGAVTAPAIARGAVDASKIKDLSIGLADLSVAARASLVGGPVGAASVTSATIVGGAVATAAATGAVSTAAVAGRRSPPRRWRRFDHGLEARRGCRQRLDDSSTRGAGAGQC